jgi:hypothetical protein
MCVATCMSILACCYLCVATPLSCRYLSVVSLLDHLCMPSTNLYIYVYGTCNRFLCMAYMFIYIFMCICCSGTCNSGNKFFFWATIRRGQCRRRRGCHMPMVKAMPRGWPSAYSPSYAEGEAVGVCPSWRRAELLPCAPIRRGGGRRRMP